MSGRRNRVMAVDELRLGGEMRLETGLETRLVDEL
ncbi:hypothetical protein SNOUR_26675 [Streptomyces noursei ATCC 11455]|nr:hypothetical protein SNOUR_26675 [Streptomyces noursei ATCC 11455]